MMTNRIRFGVNIAVATALLMTGLLIPGAASARVIGCGNSCTGGTGGAPLMNTFTATYIATGWNQVTVASSACQSWIYSSTYGYSVNTPASSNPCGSSNVELAAETGIATTFTELPSGGGGAGTYGYTWTISDSFGHTYNTNGQYCSNGCSYSTQVIIVTFANLYGECQKFSWMCGMLGANGDYALYFTEFLTSSGYTTVIAHMQVDVTPN
jgi:hypothetical protein